MTETELRDYLEPLLQVAPWNVLQSCEREGSSDSKITAGEPNNFKEFFDSYPGIKTIFFNGSNAAKLYSSHVNLRSNIQFYTLPSSSRANNWKTFDNKLKEWSIIRNHI